MEDSCGVGGCEGGGDGGGGAEGVEEVVKKD